MNKSVFYASSALVAALGMGQAQAYTVSFGQDVNSNPSTALSSFGEAMSARSRFLAGGGSLETKGFEDLAVGTSGPIDLTFGKGDTEVTARLAGTGGTVKQVVGGGSDEGRYSVAPTPGAQGTKFWQTQTTIGGSSFELWFDNPVVKFGFFGVDIGDFDGLLELEILDGTASSSTVIGTVRPGDDEFGTPPLSGPVANGSVLYFGVTAAGESEYFRGVRFRAVPSIVPTAFGPAMPTDVFAFDSFSVVAAPRTPGTIPAPGTLALLGTALAGLALMRRRA